MIIEYAGRYTKTWLTRKTKASQTKVHQTKGGAMLLFHPDEIPSNELARVIARTSNFFAVIEIRVGDWLSSVPIPQPPIGASTVKLKIEFFPRLNKDPLLGFYGFEEGYVRSMADELVSNRLQILHLKVNL
jgi:hypothetical protein